jgi:type III pantothenate kinase
MIQNRMNSARPLEAHSVCAIDVGNTRAKFGRFELSPGSLPEPQMISAVVYQTADDILRGLKSWVEAAAVQPSAVFAVAGSEPDVRDELVRNWPHGLATPQVVQRYDQIPVGVDVESPERVGMDRLLTAFAAYRMTGSSRSAIVVDSGTATTVDLITSDGVFRGGSILPGLRLSAYALHDYTARLPMLDTDRELPDLPEVPGRNTKAAMLAGLYIGQLGAVRELVHGLTDAAGRRYGQTLPPMLFVTGGGGKQLVRQLTAAIYCDSLALHGLAMLMETVV